MRRALSAKACLALLSAGEDALPAAVEVRPPAPDVPLSLAAVPPGTVDVPPTATPVPSAGDDAPPEIWEVSPAGDEPLSLEGDDKGMSRVGAGSLADGASGRPPLVRGAVFSPDRGEGVPSSRTGNGGGGGPRP